MEITRESLEANFSEKTTDELLDLLDERTLTELENQVLQEELNRRGIPAKGELVENSEAQYPVAFTGIEWVDRYGFRGRGSVRILGDSDELVVIGKKTLPLLVKLIVWLFIVICSSAARQFAGAQIGFIIKIDLLDVVLATLLTNWLCRRKHVLTVPLRNIVEASSKRGRARLDVSDFKAPLSFKFQSEDTAEEFLSRVRGQDIAAQPPLFTDSCSVDHMKSKEKPIVVGFWMRVVSELIDAIFLGVVGIALTRVPVTRQLLLDLGPAAVLAGLLLAFLYFGVLQTSFNNGQTLAKKLFRIQVLKTDGSHMSLATSFGRYSILAFVSYGPAVWSQLGHLYPNVIHDESTTLIGGLVYICVLVGVTLLVAIHPLKRGIHDLVLGTVVVRLNKFDHAQIEALENAKKERNAFVGVGICTALVFAIYFISYSKGFFFQGHFFTELANRIEDETVLERVVIQPLRIQGSSYDVDDGRKINFRVLNITSTSGRFLQPDNEAEVNEALDNTVAIILSSQIDLEPYWCINIALHGELDLGWYNETITETFEVDTSGRLVRPDPDFRRLPPIDFVDAKTGGVLPGCHIDKAFVGDPEAFSDEPISLWTVRATAPDE